MSKLVKCKTCGAEIAKDSKNCPSCGAKNKKPFYKKWWFWVVVVIVFFALLPSEEKDTSTEYGTTETIAPTQVPIDKDFTSLEEQENVESVPAEVPEITSSPDATNTLEPTETPKPTNTPKPTATPTPALTMGEKNALKSAKSYLKFTAFSYEGLKGQLEYEGYSENEIEYAVDNCGADWYEQAVKSAKNYLEFSSFSRDGLIDQLEYEGFTNEQAVYAVDSVGY